ncbi:hypothetical protein [Celerinatantimonas sp. YJH-8]|uniref:hypothetical protein n=1 Tax=Celerinatantimonas sp. YJH-8 TaxID=3228714 RepID=UPI0038C32735
MKFHQALVSLYLWFITALFVSFSASALADVKTSALSFNDLQFSDCPSSAIELLLWDAPTVNDADRPTFRQHIRQADMILIPSLAPKALAQQNARLTQLLGSDWQHQASRAEQGQQSLLWWNKKRFHHLGDFQQDVGSTQKIWVILGQLNGLSLALFSNIAPQPYTSTLSKQPLLNQRQQAIFSGILPSGVPLPAQYQIQQRHQQHVLATRGVTVCDSAQGAHYRWIKLANE